MQFGSGLAASQRSGFSAPDPALRGVAMILPRSRIDERHCEIDQTNIYLLLVYYSSLVLVSTLAVMAQATDRHKGGIT